MQAVGFFSSWPVYYVNRIPRRTTTQLVRRWSSSRVSVTVNFSGLHACCQNKVYTPELTFQDLAVWILPSVCAALFSELSFYCSFPH